MVVVALGEPNSPVICCALPGPAATTKIGQILQAVTSNPEYSA